MKIAEICKKLGYTFKDNEHLRLALTHRSIGKLNNERLEFLGDSVLNCIVGSLLFEGNDKATEGELSRLRAALVKGLTLTAIAKEFHLGDYLLLGPGELKSGGDKRDSILEGAIEAVVGAIYLDGGFEACFATVKTWYADRINQLGSAEKCKDAKTLLQEYLQGKHYDIPKYSLVETTGQAHQQTFIIRCEVPALGLALEASGASRRKAEQAVAEKILETLTHGK